MWRERAEDRAFVRELALDVIAGRATEEVDAFDALVAGYFADPTPPDLPSWPAEPGGPAAAGAPRLAAATAAAIVAVLNFLVAELEIASQQAARDGIKLGLKRLLWRGASQPGEGVRLRAARGGWPERLTLIVYCYLLPVGVTVPTFALHEVVQTTAAIYGLDEPECVELGNAVLTRLCRSRAAG